MDNKEKAYIESIEGIIEQFGTIQRNFVLDKAGIRAIINFIEQFQGRRPFFELSDPVVQKGKVAANKVIKELSKQLKSLDSLKCPDNWSQFHNSLVKSISIQLDGYREMVKVFEDSNLLHISEGQEIVNRGMDILRSGKKEG